MRTLEIRLFILTVVSWFLITPTPDGVCRDYRYGLGTGLSYTSGDYGFKDDEELFYIPLIFNAYLSDRFRGTVVLPWVHQSSTKLISAGGSFYRITGRNIREVGGSRSGLGDLLLLGEYDALIETRDRPAVVMGGKLKLPTASEDKGLGTGEVDVGATVEVGKTVHQLYYYGRLGYTFIGEPSRADFDDPFLYEAGIGYEVNRDFFLTFAVVGETSIDDNVDNPLELAVIGNYGLPSALNLNGYLSLGLSDGSPDFGIGVGLLQKF